MSNTELDCLSYPSYNFIPISSSPKIISLLVIDMEPGTPPHIIKKEIKGTYE